MKIKSKIKRSGGTVVTLGRHTYHFLPNAAGDHVADVVFKEHIAKLLACTSGYEPYDEDGALRSVEDEEPEQVSETDDEGDEDDELDLVEDEDEDEAGELDDELDAEPSGAAGEVIYSKDDLDEMSDENLVEVYRDIFDRKPGNKLRATQIADIIEAQGGE